MRRYSIIGLIGVLPLLFAGCASTGNQDMLNTVYNTNRIVRNMEQNLTPTVNKLNQSTADLGARVDASEQEMSRLGQMLESNTAQLQNIQQQIDGLTNVISRATGMTPPRTSAPTAAAPGGLQVGPVIQETPEDAALGGTPPAAVPGAAPAPVPTAPPGPSVDDTLGGPAPAPGIPVASAPATTPGSVPGAATVPGPPPTPPQPPAPAPDATPAAPADAPTGDSQQLYQKAGEDFYNGKYEQALNGYQSYLSQFPNTENTPSAQFWKGESLLKLNRYQEAIKEFDQLRKSYPTNSKVPYSMYEQAEAHLQLGQTDEAVNLLKRLVDEWPMTRPAAKAKADLEKRGIQ